MSNREIIDKYDGFEIAIIGMAGKFPGAKNVKEFWENLVQGKETISFFDDEELSESGIDEELLNNPDYVKAKGVVEDADKFDASFFGFYPREAEILDPQHRLFLETSWNALEDAGYVPDKYKGLIGMFGGVGMNTYLLSFIQANEGFVSSSEGYQLSIANDKDFLTTRISYKLNLRGPSMDVQTACSTSLVATHIACMNLLNYQCDMALAGGVTISFPEKSGYLYQEGMILSPDGHCKPFDEKANGTVASNGVGVVVLKRLADAIEDGDHIYAIIKGSAYNNDGGLRVGYTAPGVNGQIEVINSALAVANVHPETISYIETHGTGTELGDPIEIEALTQAYREYTGKKSYCAIGSVKSNIGHLDTAAGVTGLIKTALCLKNKTLVPSINFNNPNPKIDFANSPFYVNTELRKWEGDKEPLRAAVSSFGIGGTNAHVILEEAPQLKSSESSKPFKLLTVSGKTAGALERNTKQLGEFLKDNKSDNLADIAYTLQTGRKHFEYRNILVTDSLSGAADDLINLNYKKILSSKLSNPDSKPEYVFMFSGQGSQYINMGKDIYENEPVFKKYVDECAGILEPIINLDLRKILFPSNEYADIARERINQTEITQVALFTVEYALAQLYISLGIVPSVMIGHSIGEYVAACISGVMNLKDALKIVALRGKLMQSLPAGAMLSVNAGEDTVRNLIDDEISIAALNATNLTAVSGTFEAIEQFEKVLEEKGIRFTKLKTSHAFHSKMMEPILDEFTNAVAQTGLSAPQIPYYSNVSGRIIQEYEATDLSYYSKHLRYTVRFSDGINELLQNPDYVLLEVGPGTVLTTLVKNNTAAGTKVKVVSSMRHPKENLNDEAVFLSALGQLWLYGAEINWKEFYKDEYRLKVSLPTYSYDKKRYWLNIKKKTDRRINKKSGNEFDWVYAPVWKQVTYLPGKLSEVKSCLILTMSGNSNLIDFDSFGVNNNLNIEHINIKENKEINLNGKDYDKILFIVDNEINVTDANLEILYKELNGFIDFLRKVSKNEKSGINIGVITRDLFEVLGNEKPNLSGSLVSGVIKSVNQEFRNISCYHYDLDVINNKNVEIILNTAVEQGKTFAIRNKRLWTLENQMLNDLEKVDGNKVIKKNGTYLIIGGLGKIGLEIARHLSENYDANIVLTTRKNLDGTNNIDEIIKSNGNIDADKIELLKKLNQPGKSIVIKKCNVENAGELKETLNYVEEKFGSINGIFHSAGLTGEKAFTLINDINDEKIKENLSAKVDGLLNIYAETVNRDIDFIALQSSISVELGGIGLSLYTAANNFMDIFIDNIETKTKWISIDWDTWKFNGNEIMDKTGLSKYSVVPGKAVKLLDRIINTDYSGRVIISTGDLNYRIEESFAGAGEAAEKSDEPEVLHERPNIQTPYKEPETELEKEILVVWQKLLGIEKIGLYDNFFDLGGNSLTGTQLVSELREKFKVELPLQLLFDDPTISGVAEIIEKEKTKSEETLNILDDVISQVENLSEEEIQKLLNNKSGNDK